MRNAVHKLCASKPGNYTPMARVAKQEPPYMMGADLDYMWHSWQIEALKEDYSAGFPVMEIAGAAKGRGILGIMGDKPGK